jgi:hypothetical protein
VHCCCQQVWYCWSISKLVSGICTVHSIVAMVPLYL